MSKSKDLYHEAEYLRVPQSELTRREEIERANEAQFRAFMPHNANERKELNNEQVEQHRYSESGE